MIVLPVFGLFLLGIFQGILLYRAKTTLDYAAFMAARSGAMNFAQKSAMIDGLARGLMPLYAHQTGGGEVAVAYAKARADIQLERFQCH
ncbi:TadE-like protein [Halothiobacillus neapolitanus]|nr:TadE-like protein [Halothiobacillus neapolitanus]